MYIGILDLILLLILFLFIAFGFVLGLIQTIGALVGLVVGAWLAGLYYLPFAGWIQTLLLGHERLANIIAFMLIFTIVNRLVGLLFYVLNKIFNIISIIPFTKSINRLLGGLLGCLEGSLFIGISLLFISHYSFSQWFSGILSASPLAGWFMSMAGFIAPLLPATLRQLFLI